VGQHERLKLLVDQSSPNFFRPIGDEMLLIKCYSDFRDVDAFLRYSRSKSKVVKNCVSTYHRSLEPRPLVKFREVIDPGAVEFRRLTESNFHGVEVVDRSAEMLQVLKAQVQVQVLETICQVQPKYPL